MKELLSKINKLVDDDVAASDVGPDNYELDDDAWLAITNKILRASIFASFAGFVLAQNME